MIATVRHRRRRHETLQENPRGVPVSPLVPGELPRFVKSLGLDFIITPEGRVVLVELQHGFGRRGLISLFPGAGRAYRKTYWRLRRELGKSFEIVDGMRDVCADKINTYKVFARYQPPSLAFHRYTPKVEAWLRGLQSDYLLAKPPMGSCGKGILVLDRREFIARRGEVELGSARLLQQYVESKHLPGQGGGEHIGCIRHIMLVCSDGDALFFHHTPSYWRVSPSPFAWGVDKEALTANISRGAFPLAVSAEDRGPVQALAEKISAELVEHILGLQNLPRRPGTLIE